MPVLESNLEAIDGAMRDAQAGDLQAFSTIVEVFEREVRAWLIARCPPGCDPDDVAQETFVKVFRGLGEFELGTDFRAWMFAIARYQLMAECTRLKRRADYRSRYALESLVGEMESRAQESCNSEEERIGFLKVCMDEMGERSREILASRYRDNLPLSEIADRSGRSLAAIKKHLCVTRQKLHDCVQRKLASEGL